MATKKRTKKRQPLQTPEAALQELSGIVKRMENACKARVTETAGRLRPSRTMVLALVGGVAATAGILIWTSRRRQAVAAPEQTETLDAEEQPERSRMAPALSTALQELLATGISAGMKAWSRHQQRRADDEAGQGTRPQAR